jgi:hypothetical protein
VRLNRSTLPLVYGRRGRMKRCTAPLSSTPAVV